jgi:hypothetical protein
LEKKQELGKGPFGIRKTGNLSVTAQTPKDLGCIECLSVCLQGWQCSSLKVVWGEDAELH